MEGGNGLGDPDPSKSLEFWKSSSDTGHGHSLWNAGIFYLNGFGTMQNIVKGIEMIQKGMVISSDLKLPPQLQEMNPNQISILIQLVEDLDHSVDLDLLNQLIEIAKDKRVETMNGRIFKALVANTLDSLSDNKLNAEQVIQITLARSNRKIAVKEPYSPALIWIGAPIIILGVYSLAKYRKWI